MATTIKPAKEAGTDEISNLGELDQKLRAIGKKGLAEIKSRAGAATIGLVPLGRKVPIEIEKAIGRIAANLTKNLDAGAARADALIGFEGAQISLRKNRLLAKKEITELATTFASMARVLTALFAPTFIRQAVCPASIRICVLAV